MVKKAPSKHLLRLGSEIQRALLRLLRDLYESDLSLIVSISGVRVSPDSSYARIYCTFFPLKKQTQEACLDALNHESKMLRSLLSKAIQTRHTPELTFHLDQEQLERQKIDELLQQDKAMRAKEK